MTFSPTTNRAVQADDVQSGAAADGYVLTADGAGGSAFEAPAAGGDTQVAYVEFTANVSITATGSGTANTVVTAGAFTADGTSSYRVEFYSPSLACGASGSLVVELWLDGSALFILANPQSGIAVPCYVVTPRLVPAAGSRTYSVRAWRGTANGTVAASTGTGGVNSKGYIRVVKLAA